MRKVLIASGGTGGHLFPALQLASKLDQEEVLFAGHGLKNSPFFDSSKAFEEIPSGKNLKQFWTILKGVKRSLQLMKRFSPDVVVGFGSFHSFPVLLAAVIRRKKIVLFEPNCTFGKVNALLAPFSHKIAFQFPNQHKRAVFVPLLPWNRKKPCAKYEKDPDKFTILVFGGSQGAEFLNQIFPKVANLLSFPLEVIHLTGKKKGGVHYSGPSVVMEFEEDMESVYKIADLVVCRAGANTLAELIRYQKPAILIPYPYAHEHQKKNGEFLGKAATVIQQKDVSVERLVSEIEHIRENLDSKLKLLKQISLPETTEMATVLRNVMEEK